MPKLRICTILFIAICCIAIVGCTPEEPDASANTPVETPTGPDMEPAETETETSEALDAESLAGTTWSVADYTVAFEDDGVVTFNGNSKGTWSVEGTTITLEVAGETTAIEIDGDGLTQDGVPLARQ